MTTLRTLLLLLAATLLVACPPVLTPGTPSDDDDTVGDDDDDDDTVGDDDDDDDSVGDDDDDSVDPGDDDDDSVDPGDDDDDDDATDDDDSGPCGVDDLAFTVHIEDVAGTIGTAWSTTDDLIAVGTVTNTCPFDVSFVTSSTCLLEPWTLAGSSTGRGCGDAETGWTVLQGDVLLDVEPIGTQAADTYTFEATFFSDTQSVVFTVN